MSVKLVLCNLLLVGGCVGSPTGVVDPGREDTGPFSAAVVVTDLVTGEQVSLENQDGSTLVTDLESGETEMVDGEIADEYDDDAYTAMMDTKRADEKAAAQDSGENGTMNLLSGSGSFSISTSFTSPKYSKTGTTAVKTSISASTYNPGGDHIALRLRRSVSFWVDVDYGTVEYWVSYYGGGGGTKTWTSANVAGNYYVTISKRYSGYWSKGSYRLWD